MIDYAHNGNPLQCLCFLLTFLSRLLFFSSPPSTHILPLLQIKATCKIDIGRAEERWNASYRSVNARHRIRHSEIGWCGVH